MKKKLFAVLLAGVLALGLVACGPSIKEGTIGQLMKTKFFSFTVQSAQVVTRKDYTPEEGNKLVDIVIEATNTYETELPMLDMDFNIWLGGREAGDDFMDDMYFPLDPLDDTFAPIEYTLNIGEGRTYHYLYEIPEDVTEFELMHFEQFQDAEGNVSTGDAHFVVVTVG